jgi:antitoxin component of MazEF toxin-antitoxin module
MDRKRAIQKVRKVGGTLVITIPKKMTDFKEGEYVLLEFKDNKLTIISENQNDLNAAKGALEEIETRSITLDGKVSVNSGSGTIVFEVNQIGLIGHNIIIGSSNNIYKIVDGSGKSWVISPTFVGETANGLTCRVTELVPWEQAKKDLEL